MEESEQISIDDFAKIRLQVGKILAVEKLENSDKLLKFKVDIGDKEVQILSGIAEWYEPETLVGLKALVVTNLKPALLRGELSEGMLLSAKLEDQGSYSLVSVEDDLPVGAIVH